MNTFARRHALPASLFAVFAAADITVWSCAVSAQQAVPSGDATAAASPTIGVDVTAIKPPAQGSAENGYRVDSVSGFGPLGGAKLLKLPYSIQVLPEALIEDVQAKSLKDALKYLPLVQFQEQQGSEVLRPATRGMQGSNFQNTRVDGMTIFVTGGNPLEQYQQIEVLSGPSSAVFGPANPAGMFNFVNKRPLSDSFQRLNLSYDTQSILTAGVDLNGHVGANDVVGYRINLLDANGTAYVHDSELDRKLGSVAFDVRPWTDGVFELNYSAYEVQQKGYPGWFTYGQNIQLPSAPDPTRVGYGQTYAGVDLKTQMASGRFRQDFGPSWHLVVGGLYQQIDRNINTPVNNLTNNAASYTSSLANGFAPRFQIASNTGYLNGTFKTGSIDNDLTLGTTGFKAVTNSVLTPATPASVLLGTASIADPRIFAEPPGGLPNISQQYASNVAYQQGINISDTLTFNSQWAIRLAVSQDWIRSLNFNNKSVLTTSYRTSGLSPMPSIMFKPQENVSTYVTYASSLQQGDIAPAGTTNANTGLAPYRSNQWEVGMKVALSKLDLSAAVFRLERPFATVEPLDNTYKISGSQVNYGIELMAIGQLSDLCTIYGGVTLLDPEVRGTGNPATNGKQYVGMPKVRSNILLEYRVPQVAGLVATFDWQYADRRPGNDTNTTWTQSYSTFDIGARYAAPILSKMTTWRIAVNNVSNTHYWSTIGPSNITGSNIGNMVAHLGAPRTLLASVTVDF